MKCASSAVKFYDKDQFVDASYSCKALYFKVNYYGRCWYMMCMSGCTISRLNEGKIQKGKN